MWDEFEFIQITMLRNFGIAYSFLFFVFLVLLIIGICLFPLWPESVREYSWYISVAGAIFVGTILVLAVCEFNFAVLCDLLLIC